MIQPMVWRRDKPSVRCSLSPAMTTGAMRKSPMSLNPFAPHRFPLTLRFGSCQKKQLRCWLRCCSNCPWVRSWERNKREARLGMATMDGIQPVDWDQGLSLPQKFHKRTQNTDTSSSAPYPWQQLTADTVNDSVQYGVWPFERMDTQTHPLTKTGSLHSFNRKNLGCSKIQTRKKGPESNTHFHHQQGRNILCHGFLWIPQFNSSEGPSNSTTTTES